MIISNIHLAGPFTPDDVRDVADTLRAIDERRPAAVFTMTATAPEGTNQEGLELLDTALPPRPGRTPGPRRVVEHLTDENRQLLVVLLTREYTRLRYDTDMQPEADELIGMIAKLTGADTVVLCERAYPSRKQG